MEDAARKFLRVRQTIRTDRDSGLLEGVERAV
jgi:hypothetical protein